jgi:hypothetical protein
VILLLLLHQGLLCSLQLPAEVPHEACVAVSVCLQLLGLLGSVMLGLLCSKLRILHLLLQLLALFLPRLDSCIMHSLLLYVLCLLCCQLLLQCLHLLPEACCLFWHHQADQGLATAARRGQHVQAYHMHVDSVGKRHACFMHLPSQPT